MVILEKVDHVEIFHFRWDKDSMREATLVIKDGELESCTFKGVHKTAWTVDDWIFMKELTDCVVAKLDKLSAPGIN